MVTLPLQDEPTEPPLVLHPVPAEPGYFRDPQGRLWIQLSAGDRLPGPLCACGRSAAYVLVEWVSPTPVTERRRCEECVEVVGG